MMEEAAAEEEAATTKTQRSDGTASCFRWTGTMGGWRKRTTSSRRVEAVAHHGVS